MPPKRTHYVCAIHNIFSFLIQQIFLYMGTYSLQQDWLANAYKGVPLGEMVQWGDLIASLYVLGHNITISAEVPSMMR